MDWNDTEVKVMADHTLWVRFNDGVHGTVKFSTEFYRGVFLHLHDQARFREVAVVDGVVTWPGELDLAPDAMHEEIKSNGEWVPGV